MSGAPELAERLVRVRERIRAAGGGDDVEVVAVTKGHPAASVLAAVEAGCRHVAESYAQELVAKRAEIGPERLARLAEAGVRWSFIGGLQTNKVRAVAGAVDLVQSVDRPSLVAELAKRWPGAEVLVQLDLAGAAGRSGCAPAEAPELVARARDAGLVVRGLMGVAPAGPPEAARPGFRALVALADRLGLPVRSIGMSGDLEVAVEEGSTMVRVGTALLGPRPPR